MWISKAKFKRLNNYVEVLQRDVLRTRNWHKCNNCNGIFERASCISTRLSFDYCTSCGPVMQEKQNIDEWVKQNKDKIKDLMKKINY